MVGSATVAFGTQVVEISKQANNAQVSRTKSESFFIVLHSTAKPDCPTILVTAKQVTVLPIMETHQ